MTKQVPRMPSWAVFRDDRIVESGYHPAERLVVRFESE